MPNSSATAHACCAAAPPIGQSKSPSHCLNPVRGQVHGMGKALWVAANGNVFCSGHDLKEITTARESDDSGEGFFQKLFDHYNLFFLYQMKINLPYKVDPVVVSKDMCDLNGHMNVCFYKTPKNIVGVTQRLAHRLVSSAPK